MHDDDAKGVDLRQEAPHFLRRSPEPAHVQHHEQPSLRHQWFDAGNASQSTHHAIPPFVIAAERNYVFGLNTIGLRRAGFSAKDRDEIKTAFKLIYASGLNIGDAIKKAATMKLGDAAREFLDFVANAKKRGICPLKRSGEEEMSI